MRALSLNVGVAVLILVCVPSMGAEPFKDNQIQVVFPAKIGKLELRGPQKYKDPGLGYSVRYQDELFKIDVYVYDMDLKDIGDGCESRRVIAEFKDVLGVFAYFEKEGKYADVKFLKGGKTSFADVKYQFFWARCQYRELPGSGSKTPGLRTSETYMTAKSGKFIKIRATMMADDFAARKEEIQQFVQQISAILGEKQPPAQKPNEEHCTIPIAWALST